MKYILGNFKAELISDLADSENYFKKLKTLFSSYESKNITIKVAPSYLHLAIANKYVPTMAQDVSSYPPGAYTGEISIASLKQLNIKTSLIGHSERRKYFNEDDVKCHNKIVSLLSNDIDVVYCVGESLEDYQAKKSFDVISAQLKAGLADLTSTDISKIIIAYEPVWAIGTGLNATSEYALEIITKIKTKVTELTKGQVRVVYGGSVNPDNIATYLGNNVIDGVLIGKASTDITKFESMLKSVQGCLKH
jgi:triosephosphate isomerase